MVQTPLAICLQDLRFGWRRSDDLLRIASLEIRRGERVFLQGASGCGKSTLLSLLAGICTPRHGTLQILGEDLATLSGAQRDDYRRAHMGLIFQLLNLLPYLSVIENVTLPARISRARLGVRGGELRDEALYLLSALGLRDRALLARPVTSLSVGQQPRVAAARALIGRPQLVLADEPTSALDADTRQRFLELLQGECAKREAALLFVSHDASLAPAFDRALHMHDLNRV